MTTTVSNTKNTTPQKTETKYIYGYVNAGVKCRHSEEDGWEAIEEHCLNCGKRATYCDCEQYLCADWFCEATGEWQNTTFVV